MFDYRSSTKNAYKSAAIAQTYHEAFAGKTSWRTLRFKLIAHFERQAVRRLLKRISARRVLDIPCGTGKLAAIFQERAICVTAADVSAEMLETAKATYLAANASNVTFTLGDVEALASQFGRNSFDVVVCLRLMHRVPPETRAKMFAEIASVARFAIISFGVDSSYTRLRRRVRNALFGGGVEPLCTAKREALEAEVSTQFQLIEAAWVLPLVSEEIVFLLERRA